MRTPLILVPLAAMCAAPLTAQRTRPLAKAEAEFAEPFTTIAGIRELKDGRVIAVDPRDKVIQLVDFKSGSAKKIGREGSGPKEYGLPMAVFALPNDRSAVFDPLNSRLLTISATGEAGDFLKLPTPPARAGAPGGGMVVGLTPPRAADANGRFYMTGSPLSFGADGQPVRADSQPILRLDPGSGKTDTLGYLEVPKDNMQTSGGSGNFTFRVGVANPFTARDEWFVTPDGRVGIVRSPEYRLDWLTPTRSSGPTIPYDKVKVAEGHKQQWRDSRRGATAIMMTNNNGRVTTRTGSPGAGGIQAPEPTDWPEYLPPFLTNGNSVLAAPNGTVWINRTGEVKDTSPTYDVLDASGKVSYRVSLPPKTRIAGFGNGVVYTVRTDEDDLQYLQRHKLP